MADLDDDELLEALGVEVTPLKAGSRTPREERIIAGFEDILRFFRSNNRAPQHGEGRDIFERIYAVRQDQLKKLPDAQALLFPLDEPGLLKGSVIQMNVDELDEDGLLAELGVEVPVTDDSISVLRNVRPYKEIQAAQEIANRKACADFETFKPLFDEVTAGLKTGLWVPSPFAKDANIDVGDLFIVGGQISYVANKVEENITKDGRDNPRLRVIYDNETESDLLLRSLSRSLYPDGDTPVGRRVVKVKTDDGPLFGDAIEDDDVTTGTIYVLRSKSSHPFVSENRELIHKIGVTGGKVETRIARASHDATYLLADVEVVATYTLHNVNRTKVEGLFHKIFAAAQIDVTIDDRFGNPVKPREWFLVPLAVIDEAVKRIQDGSIVKMAYDTKLAKLIQ
jgi:hypothetical protein